jgi:hypothetical protein
MVLVRGHDPIAHNVINRALITVHGFHHMPDYSIKEFARFLRIPIGEQFHRPFHVGEQNGNLLAFAFEGGFRVEDLFGEMPWGVSFDRTELSFG